jgi:hypothetical protein
MKHILPLLLFPVFALANEGQIACNLERSKAEVRASILEAPSAFGSIGDASTSVQNITAGISQSMSGYKQASLTRQAADARCNAIKAALQLDTYEQWAQIQVQRSGAIEELRAVERALDKARDNIIILNPQLAAKTITIAEYNQALGNLVEIEKKKTELMKILSVVAITPAEINVNNLIESAQRYESQAANLAARSQAEAGWDVVVSAGARQPISGTGSSQLFATVGVKWSFGYSASKNAARDVGVQTAELMQIQQNGYTQTILRQRETLDQLIKTEEIEINYISAYLVHLKHIRESVDGIDTVLALNTLRSVDLQIMITESKLVGAKTILDGYKNLLMDLI